MPDELPNPTTPADWASVTAWLGCADCQRYSQALRRGGRATRKAYARHLLAEHNLTLVVIDGKMPRGQS